MKFRVIVGTVCAAALASQSVLAENLPLDYFFKKPSFIRDSRTRGKYYFLKFVYFLQL